MRAKLNDLQKVIRLPRDWKFAWAIALILPLATQVHAQDANSQGAWKAGAAQTNITPAESMWMAGYGSRTRPAEGKLQDLWAKALVLEDGSGKRGVLISLDLVGIDRQISNAITQLIAERFDLPRPAVMICTSHTHSGPAVGHNLAPLHYLILDPKQQALVDAYAKKLPETVAQTVGQAIDKMETCSVSWGNGKATFAVNRRNNSAAEAPRLRTEHALAGPYDHDVPVLAVRDAEGTLKGIVFGYACHATVLSINQWSGDYPGFAQKELEALHPEAVALFFAGCGGDQNPLPRRTVELAEHYGRRLATAVDAVLMTTKMEEIAPHWTHAYGEIDLPLGTLPSREQVEQDTKSSNKYVAARAKMLLRQWDDQGQLAKTYPYPIGLWSLADQVDWVFLGGEVVVDYAIRLKAEMEGPKTWVAGYANDVMAYIPSRRVLNEGGYEGGGAMVYYGLPTVWAPEVEEVIVKAVHATHDDLLTGE